MKIQSPTRISFLAACDRLMEAPVCQEYKNAIKLMKEQMSVEHLPNTVHFNVAERILNAFLLVSSSADADVSFFRKIYEVITASVQTNTSCRAYFCMAFSAFFKAGCVSDSFRRIFPEDVADVITEKNDLCAKVKYVLESGKDLSMIRVTYNAETKKNAVVMEFDTNEEALIEPVVEVISRCDKGRKYIESNRMFTTCLAKSIDYAINDWKDITLDIIRRQYRYFQLYPDTSAKNRSFACQLCKMLYLMLLDRYPFIATKTEISKELLIPANSLKYIGAGYRPVTLDRLRDVPTFDDWMVRLPEGVAKTGTDLYHLGSYMPISFSKLPTPYRDICKHLVWYHDIILPEKQRVIRIITQFLAFREEYRKKVASFSRQKSKDMILPEELLSFLPSCEKKTRRRIVFALRLFINYLLDTDSGIVAPDCLRVLEAGLDKVNENISAVPKDDFIALADTLRLAAERYDATSYDYLVYKLFILVALSELRTASWLSVSIDDVFELHGVYHILAVTKTSSKKKKDFIFPADIYNIVKDIIRYTEPFRRKSAPEMQSLLFLTENGTVLRRYCISWHLKQACIKAGIQQYRMQNIRKTYMTEVVKNMLKDQGSLAGMGQVFGHKSTTTTLKYYDRPETDRRIPLVLGEIPVMPDEKVAGQVVDDSKEAVAPEKVVYHECGACSKEHCTILGYQTCLVCPYFITTPNFRENFILRKKKLELAIRYEKDEDVVNRLMVALNRVNIFIKAIDERKG